MPSIIILALLATTPATSPPDCAPAKPRVAALGRGKVTSTTDGHPSEVCEGDNVELAPRGHIRLEAQVGEGRALEVTCISAASTVSLTIEGDDAPWLTVLGSACAPWLENERVCHDAAGTEVLVCSASALSVPQKRQLSDRVDRPLGLPSWFVGEVPATLPLPVLRIAVADFSFSGIEPAAASAISDAVVAEFRKYKEVSVIGLNEVTAMLALEAEKQQVGCLEDESCLAEIADSLGVDVLIVGSVATVGANRTFSIKRISQEHGQVDATFQRSLSAGTGEEVLAEVGDAVAELLPKMSLRPAQSRGVSIEIARRIVRPPIPAWAFWSATTTAAVFATSTIVLFGVTAQSNAEYHRLIEQADPGNAVTGRQIVELQQRGSILNLASGVGVVLTVLAAPVPFAMSPFVDWGD